MLKISQFLQNAEKLFVEFSAPPSVPVNIHSLSSCFISTATAPQLAGPSSALSSCGLWLSSSWWRPINQTRYIYRDEDLLVISMSNIILMMFLKTLSFFNFLNNNSRAGCLTNRHHLNHSRHSTKAFKYL